MVSFAKTKRGDVAYLVCPVLPLSSYRYHLMHNTSFGLCIKTKIPYYIVFKPPRSCFNVYISPLLVQFYSTICFIPRLSSPKSQFPYILATISSSSSHLSASQPGRTYVHHLLSLENRVSRLFVGCVHADMVKRLCRSITFI